MNERLSNTEIFNNELKNNCNCEKLLKIASKGIFLQEPLFNHPKLKYTEHVIEISILSNQFYIIRNKKQYNKFIELYKHKKNYLTYPCDDGYVFRNLILNKYVIKQLSKENNDIYSSIVNEFDMSEIMILLCFFYKYDFISLNVFNLFKNISDYYEITDDVYMIMELFNFFYIDNKLNDINILNINLLYQKIKQSTGKTEINFENLLYLVVQNFGRDINILKYISENCKYTYSTECIDMFRLPLLNHPLNVLMKYSCKLFKQNKYYLKHNNKNIELFVNAIFSDFGLKCINFFCGYPNDCFNVYDISLINEECENFDLYINNKNSTIIDISNNNNDNNNNDDNNNDNNNNDNNNDNNNNNNSNNKNNNNNDNANNNEFSNKNEKIVNLDVEGIGTYSNLNEINYTSMNDKDKEDAGKLFNDTLYSLKNEDITKDAEKKLEDSHSSKLNMAIVNNLNDDKNIENKNLDIKEINENEKSKEDSLNKNIGNSNNNENETKPSNGYGNNIVNSNEFSSSYTKNSHIRDYRDQNSYRLGRNIRGSKDSRDFRDSRGSWDNRDRDLYRGDYYDYDYDYDYRPNERDRERDRERERDRDREMQDIRDKRDYRDYRGIRDYRDRNYRDARDFRESRSFYHYNPRDLRIDYRNSSISEGRDNRNYLNDNYNTLGKANKEVSKESENASTYNVSSKPKPLAAGSVSTSNKYAIQTHNSVTLSPKSDNINEQANLKDSENVTTSKSELTSPINTNKQQEEREQNNSETTIKQKIVIESNELEKSHNSSNHIENCANNNNNQKTTNDKNDNNINNTIKFNQNSTYNNNNTINEKGISIANISKTSQAVETNKLKVDEQKFEEKQNKEPKEIKISGFASPKTEITSNNNISPTSSSVENSTKSYYKYKTNDNSSIANSANPTMNIDHLSSTTSKSYDLKPDNENKKYLSRRYNSVYERDYWDNDNRMDGPHNRYYKNKTGQLKSSDDMDIDGDNINDMDQTTESTTRDRDNYRYRDKDDYNKSMMNNRWRRNYNNSRDIRNNLSMRDRRIRDIRFNRRDRDFKNNRDFRNSYLNNGGGQDDDK